jgi:hypothetical protein
MSSTYPDLRFASGPTYNRVLFPFTYSNGVLDLPASFLTTIGTNAPENAGVQVRRLGGDYLVQRLGPNLKQYLYNISIFDGYKIQNTSSIQISLPGIVTRVQQVSLTNLPEINTTSYKVSETAPTPDFIGYNGCYLFDKPLVISAYAKRLGDNTYHTIYVTLYTSWNY